MTNTTQTEKLVAGTEVYWTGNMGSREGAGKIVAVDGSWLTIAMDDGRDMKHIPAAMFSGRAGASVFWIKAEWEARQAAALADMIARMKETRTRTAR